MTLVKVFTIFQVSNVCVCACARVLRVCARMCTRLTVSVDFTSSKIGVHSRSDAERVSDSRLHVGLYQLGAVALRPRPTSVAVNSHFSNVPRHKYLKNIWKLSPYCYICKEIKYQAV